MQAIEQRHYTPDEYLELETLADYKSEYIDGQIIPMTGGSTNHNRIALNLSANLNMAFKQSPYEVFIDSSAMFVYGYLSDEYLHIQM
jgi:Uma2 family endonuclease